MSKCGKLLKRAQASPASLRFLEVCQLAECYGFVFVRQDGSHRLYKRKGYREVMNFQEDNGKAKTYQVKQLLTVIEVLGQLYEEESANE